MAMSGHVTAGAEPHRPRVARSLFPPDHVPTGRPSFRAVSPALVIPVFLPNNSAGPPPGANTTFRPNPPLNPVTGPPSSSLATAAYSSAPHSAFDPPGRECSPEGSPAPWDAARPMALDTNTANEVSPPIVLYNLKYGFTHRCTVHELPSLLPSLGDCRMEPINYCLFLPVREQVKHHFTVYLGTRADLCGYLQTAQPRDFWAIVLGECPAPFSLARAGAQLKQARSDLLAEPQQLTFLYCSERRWLLLEAADPHELAHLVLCDFTELLEETQIRV